MDDRFYVEIQFDKGYTRISKLKTCIISDTIKINHPLHLDLQNYSAALDKIKLLVIMS